MWQLPHRLQDDELCAPLGTEAHDESKHVFTASAPAGHQDHCAICHWTRWLKPLLAATVASAAGHGAGADFVAIADVFRRPPATDQIPPRAPPSEQA